MKVSNEQIYAMQEMTQRRDTKNTTENDKFASLLEKPKSEEETTVSTKGITDSDVDNFINKLTSMGASAFWLNFNLEKIQEKIDKKREELMEKLGLNKTNSEEMTGDDKQAALKELEKLLDDYIKELMEQMKAKKELANSQKPSSPLASLLNQVMQ